MFKKNSNLKILAFFIAFIIWLQLTLLEEQITVMNIPIRVVNVPDNLYLYKQEILKIPLRVKGRGIHILLFFLSGPTIDYNGSGLKQGNNLINMDTLQESLPFNPDLTFQGLKSDNILILTTDRIVQKEVPVVFQFETERVKQNLINEKYSFNDVNVLISGPSLEINKTDAVYAERISNDFLKSRRRNIRILPVNEHLVIVPPQIELKQVTELITSKTISYIPIYHNQDLYNIFPQRVSIKIEGNSDSLKLINQEDIRAYILEQDYTITNEAEIQFKIPNYIKIIDYTPKKVSISIND